MLQENCALIHSTELGISWFHWRDAFHLFHALLKSIIVIECYITYFCPGVAQLIVFVAFLCLFEFSNWKAT